MRKFTFKNSSNNYNKFKLKIIFFISKNHILSVLMVKTDTHDIRRIQKSIFR